MNMKTIIIGAGVSGVTAAIAIKRNNPKEDVLIIEHLDKPLKKVLATGNGKCNLTNINIKTLNYKNAGFVKQIIKKDYYEILLNFFESIGFKIKLNGDLIYPMSESAITVRDCLLLECRHLGIKINVEESLIDYKSKQNGYNVTTNKTKYDVDRLIFATGGKSTPKLGSTGDIISILERHNYQFETMMPGLCPISVKENTKDLNGIRVKARVSLYKDHRVIHQESGEVLFKEHGLSGIAIMNIASLIARDINSSYLIELDLLELYTEEETADYLEKYGAKAFLRAFLHPTIASYFEKNKINPLFAKRLFFTFDELASFDFSQVSVGGLSLTDIKPTLESKLEKNIFFLGELLDVDGPCGGYNLTWAFLTGLMMK